MSEADVLDAVRSGDRRALARAITLVESSRDDHRQEAAELLVAAMPSTGGAVRVGITGPPGVGKSTFIEALGLHLVDAGHRVAVLAVDPSSSRTGGSILGDKTRMPELGRREQAFIRPSPSGTSAGGAARRTREALLVCEAAGFDVVLVETVGSGQSDVAVADMVDEFVVLVPPAGGDELQGVKRGVLELADVVVITKSDGELAGPAQQTAADYSHALALLQGGDHALVQRCSAVDGTGIAEVWDAVMAVHRRREESGELTRRRRRQAVAWLWAEVRATLTEQLETDDDVRRVVPRLEEQVANGELSPLTAAAQVLEVFGTRPP